MKNTSHDLTCENSKNEEVDETTSKIVTNVLEINLLNLTSVIIKVKSDSTPDTEADIGTGTTY